jgi:hypothetical protein
MARSSAFGASFCKKIDISRRSVSLMASRNKDETPSKVKGTRINVLGGGRSLCWKLKNSKRYLLRV